MLNLPTLGSPIAAYAFRLLRLEYWGLALVRIRRSSDSAEADFSHDSTGWLTSSSVAFNSTNPSLNGLTLASFFAAQHGYLALIYEQGVGAAGNWRQTTGGNQPQIVSNGSLLTLNGKPAAIGAGVYSMASINNTGLSGNVSATVAWVGSYSALGGSRCAWSFGTFTTWGAMGWIQASATKPAVSFINGSFNNNFAPSLNTQYSVVVKKSPGAINTTTSVYTNGNLGGDDGGSTSATPSIGNGAISWGSKSGEQFYGYFQELVLWGSTTPDQSAIFTDQDAAYLIP